MTSSSGKAAARRVIVVGAGEVAESCWLPGAALLRWPVQVLDIDRDRAASLATGAGRLVQSVESLAEAAPADDDIVVVATPPETHGAVAREAVAVGARRLVIEKPPFASSVDMDETLAVLRRQPTAVEVAFIRRAWGPIATAARLYPSWRESFGALVRVRVTEGRPYGWRSRASSERGIAGLSSMFLAELPHPLDALFRIAGWTGTPTVALREVRIEPLDVDVELSLELDGGAGASGVGLRILGSRTVQLPNALDFGFERGSVTVEMEPNGGIVVRSGSGRTLVSCDGMSTGVESMFAALLSTAASKPLTAAPDELEAWRGPLAVIEAVENPT